VDPRAGLDVIFLAATGKSRDSSVSIAIGYGLDDRGVGVKSPGRVKNDLVYTSSRPALGSTQSPIQWVRGSFPRG
jgi:hypothetical protein